MRKGKFSAVYAIIAIIVSPLVVGTALVPNTYGAEYDSSTQVVTVYFAGTVLKSSTVFHYGGNSPNGQLHVPELLQYLYHDQDDSDPNHHKIWVDGIGNDHLLDAQLAARHANLCKLRGFPADPWDPKRKTVGLEHFGWFRGVYYTAGFECWDYRLRQSLYTNQLTDLFKIMDANRNSPIILNILGHSRGGVLAMMLADKVSKLQRRYDADGELMPEHEKFLAVNIINFDAVPGNIEEIGLLDESTHKFVKSNEFFDLDPRVSNYVGFYAKDERQNLFEAVIPHHGPETTSWHLAFNGAHQTLVGNPRKDGHKYHPLASQDYAQPLAVGSITGYHSGFDTSASDVGVVTSIISRELLGSEDWGSVEFKTSWRSSRSDLNYGSANCEEDEQDCARYFLEKYASHSMMPTDTRSVMRSVTNPRHSAIIPEGGLQAWNLAKNDCSVRITSHPQYAPVGTEHGKCTYRAQAGGDLVHVSLIDHTPNRTGSGITDKNAEDVCHQLVELTDLAWTCKQ